ncbi:UDP-glucuronosyl/UDP-glucosyltransferase [Artemisia annua]|uniref:UDP-glucuronosyl/UDP-glucosyltransferase n=1 Tax=Artemisia annua TaxID=35608 RepID=A0A2U1PMC3_ARTAN|nr:UDP-glucuronosyl/UDP-glucosyltransferase [Artemisia annua]
MGHLIPMVEFAKRLVTNNNLSVTFIITNDGPLAKSQLAFLDSLPNAINYLLLPPVDFQDLPEDVKIETRICLMIHEAFSTISIDKKIVALFVDLFGTDAFDVAIAFGVPKYVFFPASAMTLSLLLHLPTLDQMVSCEYKDLPDPINIPGCMPIHGKDFLDPLQDRKNDAYKLTLHNSKRYMLADGIVINSFKELEGGAIEALQEEQAGKPPVYPVGPLIQAVLVNSSMDVNGSSCLRWLDDQPRGKDSNGWLKPPNDQKADAAYFNSNGHNDTFDFLPDGFIERTKYYGLVGSGSHVGTTSPNLEPWSTGGFLTHCGWNSVLDTVVQGVPMIVWPFYAEQKMNALMLTEGLKVSLRAKFNRNGIVDRLEIARVKLLKVYWGEKKENGHKFGYKSLKKQLQMYFAKMGVLQKCYIS